MIVRFPTLYAKGRNGKVTQWKVWAEDDVVVSEAGQIEGKKTTNRKHAKIKNVGKENETSPEEQAVKDARSKWEHNLARKYFLTIEETHDERVVAMLAHGIDRLTNDFFPCLAQEKLDGMRCTSRMTRGKVVLLSKEGVALHIPHLEYALGAVLEEGEKLDGELYAFDDDGNKLHLQDVLSLVKKNRKESLILQYCVYDYPCDKPQAERSKLLRKWFQDNAPRQLTQIRPNGECQPVMIEVPTLEVNDLEDAKELMEEYITAGKEGLILRKLDGLYEYGFRSPSLIKLIKKTREEFRVIGHETWDKNGINYVKWVCEMKGGQTFEAKPVGTLLHLEELLANAETYYGKWLTVEYRFNDFTKDGKPKFAQGIAFRPEEDFDPDTSI